MNEFQNDISARASDRMVQPRKLLWITRGIMAVLAGLIGLLILSSPELTVGLKSPADKIDELFHHDGAATPLNGWWEGAELTTESAPRPEARVLPASRLPVRRGTADPAGD